jgi:hypothetical protein
MLPSNVMGISPANVLDSYRGIRVPSGLSPCLQKEHNRSVGFEVMVAVVAIGLSAVLYAWLDYSERNRGAGGK